MNLRNLLKKFIFIFCLILTIWRIIPSTKRYLEKATKIEMIATSEALIQFPPIIVCSRPFLNPLKLLELVPNLQKYTYMDLNDFYDLMYINTSITVGQLVNNASWKLEELIDSVEIGDIKEIYQPNMTTNIFSWKKTYSLLGPCYTLTVPEIQNIKFDKLTIKLQNLQKNYRKCNESDLISNDIFFINALECLSREFQCICSEFFIRMGNIIHISLNMTHSNPSMNYNYFPILNTWSYRDQGFTLRLQKINFLKDNLPDNWDPEYCLYSCCFRHFATYCKKYMFNYKNINQSVNEVCITKREVDKLADAFYSNKEHLIIPCFKECGTSKRFSIWNVVNNYHVPEDTIEIKIDSDLSSEVTENERYPLTVYLSSLGGLLSMVLGISLYSLFKDSSSFIIFKSALKTNKYFIGKLYEILKMSFQLLFVFLTILQTSQLIENFISQKQLAVISLKQDKSEFILNQSTLYDYSVSAIGGSLLKHFIGCSPSINNPSVTCITNCMMQLVVYIPLIHLSIAKSNLPGCSSGEKSKIKFHLDSEIFDKIVSYESYLECTTDECKQDYLSLNHSVVVQKEYTIVRQLLLSRVDLICLIGGSIGLYLGYSLYDLTSIFNNYKENITQFRFKVKEILKPSLRFLSYTIKVVSFCILCGFVIHKVIDYLETTKITSETVAKDISIERNLTMTFCFWPPFQIEYVISRLYMKDLLIKFSSLNESAKFLETQKLFEDLPSSISNRENFWNLGTRKLSKSREEWVNVKSDFIFEKCFEIKDNDFDDDDAIEHTMYERLDYFSSVVYFIHRLGEDYIMSPITELEPFPTVINIKRATDWNNKILKSGINGKCIRECLHDQLNLEYGCNLPWIPKDNDITSCNNSQVARYFASLWKLGPQPSSFVDSIFGETTINICKNNCLKENEIVYEFAATYKTKDFFKSFHGSSTGISFNSSFRNIEIEVFNGFNSVEEVKQITLYHFNDLVNDIGGIIGMTFGVSLFSLLTNKIIFS